MKKLTLWYCPDCERFRERLAGFKNPNCIVRAQLVEDRHLVDRISWDVYREKWQ